MRGVLAAAMGGAALIAAGCASSSGPTRAAVTTISAPTATTSGLTAPRSPPVGLAGTVPPPGLAANSNLSLPSFPGAAAYDGQATVTGQSSFALAADRFAPGQPVFAPTVLIGSPGQHVTLVITNKTPTAHNFTIEAENIDQPIAIGATISVPVIFPTKGVIVFYCKIHAADAQAGELVALS